MTRLNKKFDFNLRRDQKNFYVRHDYESVDEKEPILGYAQKNYEKKNSDSKGLTYSSKYIIHEIFYVLRNLKSYH